MLPYIYISSGILYGIRKFNDLDKRIVPTGLWIGRGHSVANILVSLPKCLECGQFYEQKDF